MDYGLRGESIICFAGEDWWYHHPHSKNHILKRLACDNKVLFVNSLTLGLPSVSNPDFFLKIRRKLKSYARWFRKVPEGLYVMSPIILPFFGSPTVRVFNRVLLLIQIRFALFLAGMGHPIVWAAIPSAADIALCLKGKLLLYQVSDKYDANEDSALAREVIHALDDRLKRSADVVLYSGRKLFDESDLPHRYFLEQAVDFDHFAVPSSETAQDIGAIPHPVLGYFGTMDYVMDVALIEEVARRRPDWHWVLIGLRSNPVQIDAPNVHFLGPKPYANLPTYVRHVDVFVLPWRKDHVFVSYGSAIKVREYMATGKPVVMAPLYEYQQAPGVRFYNTPDEFIAAVEDVFQNDTLTDRELRQAFVRNGTWDIRTQEIAKLIATHLGGGPIPEAKPGGQSVAWAQRPVD